MQTELQHKSGKDQPGGLSLLEISGALSSRLIHDLTNQISSIVGNAEFASYVAEGDERLIKAIQAIRTASNTAGQVLGQWGQLRMQLAKQSVPVSATALVEMISVNLSSASGWRVNAPAEMALTVNVHPTWLARAVLQIVLETKAGSGVISFHGGPLAHPWCWRGTPPTLKFLQMVLSYRGSQPLFNAEGPASAKEPGLIAAWELVRCFRGQIHARTAGPDRQEIALILPQYY